MEDERAGEMNLDLNLGPISPGSAPGNETGSVIGEGLGLGQSLHRRFRQALRNRQRWRGLDWGLGGNMPLQSHDLSMDPMVDSGANSGVVSVTVGHDVHGTMMQTGEGSNVAEAMNEEVAYMCKTFVSQGESAAANKEDVEKGVCTDGISFFDCNICLDLAKEPVVTSCGHLFCWPCIYRWLHIHSNAKECPVCKGEVTVKNVTPIFGRCNGVRDCDEDPGVKIPDRPPARRVESLRQEIQRDALSNPMEEMLRNLGSRSVLTRNSFQPQDGDGHHNLLDRNRCLLGRMLATQGLRFFPDVVPTNDVDRRPSQTYRGASTTVAASGTTSAERLVDTAMRTTFLERSQEWPPSVDDRDSFSSITAMIHGESQTLDTAVEIDSTISLSTSSSRRRNDASRISDVDSGDSRMPRRRRLN